MHCDTTFNLFNSEQIAGGVGITDSRHKLPSTAVFITRRRASTRTTTRRDHEEGLWTSSAKKEGPLVYVGLG